MTMRDILESLIGNQLYYIYTLIARLIVRLAVKKSVGTKRAKRQLVTLLHNRRGLLGTVATYLPEIVNGVNTRYVAAEWSNLIQSHHSSKFEGNLNLSAIRQPADFLASRDANVNLNVVHAGSRGKTDKLISRLTFSSGTWKV